MNTLKSIDIKPTYKIVTDSRMRYYVKNDNLILYTICYNRFFNMRV